MGGGTSRRVVVIKRVFVAPLRWSYVADGRSHGGARSQGAEGGGVIPGERTEATLEAKRRVNSRDGAALSSRVIRVSG